MEGPNYDIKFKIVLLGDHKTGISSIILRYCFPEEFLVDNNNIYLNEYGIKMIKVNNKKIKLYLWDNPPKGHVCFFQVPKREYNFRFEYKGAHGFIFIYDISNKESFEFIKEKINDMKSYEKKYSLNNNIPKILIGNKCDIEIAQKCMDASEAKKFAKENGMEYFETSAINDICVNEAFECLINQMMKINDEDENYSKGFNLYKAKKRFGCF